MTYAPLLFPPLLVSDDTTFSAVNCVADVNNCRVRGGRWEPIGGWTLSRATAATGPTDFYACEVGGTNYFIYGRETELSATSLLANAPTTILSVAAPWAFDRWGNTLLALGVGGKLYQWTGSGSASEIVAAPDNSQDMLVSAERQVLLFGSNEVVSGTQNYLCIRISDLEDLTDWTPSATNNAEEIILEGQGRIIAGRRVGPYIAVWTQDALYVGQFVGNPGQTYRFDKIAEGCGLTNRRSVAIVNGTAYWMATDLRFRMWTPGGLVTPLPCPIGEEFRDNLDLSWLSSVYAFVNNRFQEISWFYPDTRDSTSENPSRYVTVCLGEPGVPWYRGQLQRDAMFEFTASSNQTVAFGADKLGNVFTHESGNGLRSWHVQSSDQYLANSQRRMMVKRAIPDFEDQAGNVSLTLTSRNHPNGSVTTHTVQTLATSTTKKDFRASGMIFAAKFSGAADTFARIGKPQFDVIPMGER